MNSEALMAVEIAWDCTSMTNGAPMENEHRPCPLCNDTGFVMEAEAEFSSVSEGKPDIFVPKPCPNGCLPPQK
jgi:hypothetical protein